MSDEFSQNTTTETSSEFTQSGTATEVVTQSNISDKSLGLAIVLAIFLGGLGIHRFYLGRVLSGLCILGLSITGGVLSLIGLGFFILGFVLLWCIIDIIRLCTGGLTDKEGRRLR